MVSAVSGEQSGFIGLQLVSGTNTVVASFSKDSSANNGEDAGFIEFIGGVVSSLESFQANFQAGVDTLYNKCSGLGYTPAGKSPGQIATKIQSIYDGRYTAGYNAGQNNATININNASGHYQGQPSKDTNKISTLSFGSSGTYVVVAIADNGSSTPAAQVYINSTNVNSKVIFYDNVTVSGLSSKKVHAGIYSVSAGQYIDFYNFRNVFYLVSIKVG